MYCYIINVTLVYFGVTISSAVAGSDSSLCHYSLLAEQPNTALSATAAEAD